MRPAICPISTGASIPSRVVFKRRERALDCGVSLAEFSPSIRHVRLRRRADHPRAVRCRNAWMFVIAHFGVPQMRFGHGNRTTMSGDDYGLPRLDVVERLAKSRLASQA
jgi:hypothetical protein